MFRILIADDEEGIRSFLRTVIEQQGHEVRCAEDGLQAKKYIDAENFHLLITDLSMPGLDGMQVLRHSREVAPEMEVVVLTAHGTVETAVAAMKLGALDYLTKPISSPDALRLVVQRALERRQLRDAQQRSDDHGQPGQTLIAKAPKMLAVVQQLDKVAATKATVLLLGESGSGKEVAARRIHHKSPRSSGPFVAVNCAAVSPQLIESELFGHEKGAFTGANNRRRGRFELADGGTLFLDEIGELPMALQAKLLRILQERSFERVGGSRTISVDLRIVAATNRDLAEAIAQGQFREDLYHRLAVFPVQLPPLRDRHEDIAPLSQFLLKNIGRELGKTQLQISDAALQVLREQTWPGNVRELSNVLERAAILCENARIEVAHLLLHPTTGAMTHKILQASQAETSPQNTTLKLKDLERNAIIEALDSSAGHRQKAADLLGISVRSLYSKLREYELDKN